MATSRNYEVLEIEIALYGNCGVGVKRGVVKHTLDYMPASTFLGGIASSYLFYGCGGQGGNCLNCTRAGCPLRKLIDDLGGRKLSFTHFTRKVSGVEHHPEKQRLSLKEFLGLLVKMMSEEALREVRKSVQVHLALNRASKSVQTMLELSEETSAAPDKKVSEGGFRGMLYGDEVWAPPKNIFVGYAIGMGDSLENLMKLLWYANLARIGSRSKYCFAEITRQPSKFQLELSNLQESEFYIAPFGLALEASDLQSIGIRLRRGRFSIVTVNYMENAEGIGYTSLYQLLRVGSRNVLVSEPMALCELYDGQFDIEWALLGIPGSKLSPLGWNKLVPRSLIMEG